MYAFAADCAEVGQKSFTRCLDCGDCARFRLGSFNYSLRTSFLYSTYIKMITNEMEERYVLCEISGAKYGVSVSAGFVLIYKGQMPGMISSNRSECGLIFRMDDDTNIVDSCPYNFINNNV